MDREQFEKEIQTIHGFVNSQLDDLNAFYDILDDQGEVQKRSLIELFLKESGITINDESRLATVSRLVNLQEESFVQILKKQGFSEAEIENLREKAYHWVAQFHLKSHEALLDFIESKQLLTPFYRTLLKGVHSVGKAMSLWHPEWQRHIIFTINKQLQHTYNDDDSAVYAMLESNALFDLGHNHERADRSYSVLKDNQGSFERLAYSQAFPKTLGEVIHALHVFRKTLETQEDPLFDQKDAYLSYIDALIEAFSESNPDQLVLRWADVDRKWMSITAPLQPGHPLEYYEDKYRMAVAPEWDLRLEEPGSNAGALLQDIHAQVRYYIEKINTPSFSPIYKSFQANLDRVQLYISKPVLYYGSEFNGLFSAQVVPNDEIVSKELGKKIFAFPNRVLNSLQAKPFLKLHAEIFEKSFQNQYKTLLFKQQALWFEVYRITTIGHEYGHILWMDEDTEMRMNSKGMFKNIEEFKATTGGLCAYFLREDQEALEAILIEHIKRSVGLIGWMEHNDALPYYCEALIHLCGLFESGVLTFQNEKLHVTLDQTTLPQIRQWYLETYARMIRDFYLPKQDAAGFLGDFAQKDSGHFLPVEPTLKAFVEYYWQRYQAIGQVIDEADSPKNWK